MFRDERPIAPLTKGLVDEMARSAWDAGAYCCMPNHIQVRAPRWSRQDANIF